MNRKRFSVEQIVTAVKLHGSGTTIADINLKMGTEEGTFYRWKKDYGGLEPDQLRELKQHKDENARFKKLVADRSIDKACYRTLIRESGKRIATSSSGALLTIAVQDQRTPRLPACKVVSLSFSLSTPKTAENSTAGTDKRNCAHTYTIRA